MSTCINRLVLHRGRWNDEAIHQDNFGIKWKCESAIFHLKKLCVVQCEIPKDLKLLIILKLT